MVYMDTKKQEENILSRKVNSFHTLIYFYIKRTFDIAFSTLGIVVLFIPFLIIALIIKWDDPHGTIIFKQERVGRNGVPFLMYKFRSMYNDAEEKLEDLLQHNEIEGAMFKMQNDPRITPIGKVLRKFSIDELPQLFNVLRGEMSLVGPRPALPREVQLYNTYDKQRLLTTPGITGLWQVSGRNSVSFERMVELDIYYIKNISLYNDFVILLKTVKVVITASDAY